MTKLIILLILLLLSCNDNSCKYDTDCDTGMICKNSNCSQYKCPTGYKGDKCEKCAEGFQDNNNNGECYATCEIAHVDCGKGKYCNDSSGIAKCEIAENCENITCNNNGDCEIKNSKAMCVCNDNYHAEELNCLPNIKDIDCSIATNPLNSKPIIVKVKVSWNNETKEWSNPQSCKWSCEIGYHNSEDMTTCLADPLIVNAGNDKNIQINTVITMSGSSNYQNAKYQWKRGANILSDNKSFDYTPTKIGKEILTLTVTDIHGNKASDNLLLNVHSKNLLADKNGNVNTTNQFYFYDNANHPYTPNESHTDDGSGSIEVYDHYWTKFFKPANFILEAGHHYTFGAYMKAVDITNGKGKKGQNIMFSISGPTDSEKVEMNWNVSKAVDSRLAKLTKIRKLISDAKAGIKSPLFLIAGDSTRDSFCGNQQVLYNKELKKLGIKYYHSAKSGIQSATWIDPNIGEYPNVKIEINRFAAENVIMEYSLGINDYTYADADTPAEKKIEVKNKIKNTINTILRDYPNINIFLVAPYHHSYEPSIILQEIYKELSDELNLPMMSTPSRTEYVSTNTNDNLEFSKDGTHPTYAGALRIFNGVMKFITDKNDTAVQNILDTTEELYSPIPAADLTRNLILGEEIIHKIRIFDDPDMVTSHDNARGVKIPVIGGSVLKFVNLPISTRIKLLGTDTDDTMLKELGFAYSDVSTRASETSIIPMRKEIDKNIDDPENTKYLYIYVPKQAGGIFINMNMFDAVGATKIDTDIANGDIKVTYANPTEIGLYHPTRDIINTYDQDIYPSYMNQDAEASGWEEVIIPYTATVTGDYEISVFTHRYAFSTDPLSFVKNDGSNLDRSAKIYVDDFFVYESEDIFSKEHYTPKIAFESSYIKIDALGNWSIKEDGEWKNFFPKFVYQDYLADFSTRAKKYAEYGFTGYNNLSTVDKIKTAITNGMKYNGIQINGMNITNESDDVKNSIINLRAAVSSGELPPTAVIKYEFDNEGRLLSDYNYKKAVTQWINENDKDPISGKRARPINMLNGVSEGVARNYGNDYQDIVATYLAQSGEANNEHRNPESTLEMLQEIQNQVVPVSIMQMQCYYHDVFIPSIFKGISDGAKGLSFWRGGTTHNGCETKFEDNVWAPAIKDVFAKIDTMLPIIREPKNNDWIAKVDDPALISVGTRNHDGKHYLILANFAATDKSVNIHTEGINIQTVKDFFTKEILTTVTNGDFQLILGHHNDGYLVLELE